MVDSPEEQNKPLDPDKPLVLQRHHGWIESIYPNVLIGGRVCSRSRLLHKRAIGKYPPGRHEMGDYGNLHQINKAYGTPTAIRGSVGVHPEFYLCWFGKFSPFEATKQRYIKLNALRTHMVSPVAWDKESDLPKYEAELAKQQVKAIDLRSIPTYSQIYNEILGKL
jgi:hypothetical protein